jgi:hypothetical protein
VLGDGVPPALGLDLDNVLGALNGPFLYGTSGAQRDPPQNPVQSPDVNNGLVSDLIAISGSPGVSLIGAPGVDEIFSAAGSGVINAPQQDITPQTQNLGRPSV